MDIGGIETFCSACAREIETNIVLVGLVGHIFNRGFEFLVEFRSRVLGIAILFPDVMEDIQSLGVDHSQTIAVCRVP